MSQPDDWHPNRSNYYLILGLPNPGRIGDSNFSSETLKAAYRRALLLHHPDKIDGRQDIARGRDASMGSARFMVDQIVRAYETLSNPAARATYEKDWLKRSSGLIASDKSANREALEVVDLEDLEYDNCSQSWSKSCRCGGTYTVQESELNKAASEGEIVLGCHNCSLWIKVVFEIVDETSLF